MVKITKHFSVLTLNFNGLNSPIKRHHLANWIKKADTTICHKYTHFIDRKKLCVRVKGWKNIYQAYGPPKQAGEAILISNKVEFKPKLVRRDKEGHFILITGAIHQVEITIINLHVPKSLCSCS
jgi:exonuclease III